MSMSLLSISFQFGWFVMPQISGSLQVLFGDYGFVPVFAGVILFYGAAIILERRFFLGGHAVRGRRRARRLSRAGVSGS